MMAVLESNIAYIIRFAASLKYRSATEQESLIYEPTARSIFFAFANEEYRFLSI